MTGGAQPPDSAVRTGMLSQTGFALALRLFGAALALLLTIAITRSLGSTGSGTYYLGFTLALAAATIARFGLDQVLLREASAGFELGQPATVKASWDAAMVATLSLGVLATGLLWVFSPMLATAFDDPALASDLRAMSLIVIPLNTLMIASEVNRAKGNISAAVASQVVLVPALTLPCVVLIGLLGTATATAVSGAYVAGAIVAAFVTVLSIHPKRLGPRVKSEILQQLRVLFRSGRPLVVASALGVVTAWTDTLMLGLWATPAEVGIYSATLRVALVVGFATYAVNSVVAPRFAALKASRSTGDLAALSRAANALALGVALPIALVLVVGSSQILAVFGPDFVDGRSALIVLVSCQVLAATFASCGYLLMMTGHEKLFRNSVLFGAVVNVALNALLIPPFGIVGAATATGLTLIGVSAASLVQARHALGFWAFPRFTGSLPLLRNQSTR